MAVHTISVPALPIDEVKEKTAAEACLPLTLTLRIENLLRDVFEGHEELLGLTPD